MSDNLIPFNERTEEEQREIARKGGKASGEVRRKRKAMREQAEMFLSMGLKDEKLKSQLSALGIDEDTQDYQIAMIVAMVNSAIKGNVNAFNSIREIVGERVVEVNMNTNVDERQREIEKLLENEDV